MDDSVIKSTFRAAAGKIAVPPALVYRAKHAEPRGYVPRADSRARTVISVAVCAVVLVGFALTLQFINHGFIPLPADTDTGTDSALMSDSVPDDMTNDCTTADAGTTAADTTGAAEYTEVTAFEVSHDIDGDGIAEVIAVLYSMDTQKVFVRVTDGDDVKTTELTYHTYVEYYSRDPEPFTGAKQVTFADLDSDGLDEMIICADNSSGVSAFYNVVDFDGSLPVEILFPFGCQFDGEFADIILLTVKNNGSGNYEIYLDGTLIDTLDVPGTDSLECGCAVAGYTAQTGELCISALLKPAPGGEAEQIIYDVRFTLSGGELHVVNAVRRGGEGEGGSSTAEITTYPFGYYLDTKTESVTILYPAVDNARIVIPAYVDGYPVTAIADEAFRNGSLVSIVIPRTVTSIGKGAFSNCTSLVSVTFEDGIKLEAIPEEAFFNCTALKTLVIPDGVKTVDATAFGCCSALEELTLPGSLTIEETLLRPCTSLKTLILLEGTETVRELLLHLNTSIEKVVLPDSVTKIERLAFGGCTSLREINLPKGLTEIGESAFNDCESLETIYIPDSVTLIGDAAFGYCYKLNVTHMSENLVTIGASAFCNCYALTLDSLPASLEKIGSSAFSGCASLRRLNVHSGIKSVGDYCFSASGLTSVSVASDTTVLGVSVFSGCTALTEAVLPRGTLGIPDNTFSECDLSAFDMPESVVSIGAGAFEKNKRLKSVYLGESVASVGEGAFGYTMTEVSVSQGNSVFYSDGGALYKYSYKEYSNALIYLPAERSGELIVPEGAQILAAGAIRSTQLSSIRLPSSLIAAEAYSILWYGKSLNLYISDNTVSMEWKWIYGSDNNVIIWCHEGSAADRYCTTYDMQRMYLYD